MARIVEPTKKQLNGYKRWIASRPENVKAIAERFEPWSLYRMKSTGDRVTVASFYGDGTISVNITGEYNFTLFDRNVFGIDPDDLEPCDLPSQDEITGTMLSPEDVDDNLDALRVMVRPDLFEMGDDGEALRKSTTATKGDKS